MEAKTLIRSTVLLVCVAATTLGLKNTYGDNTEVLAQAQRTACGEPGCSYSLLRESRSAFSHEYSFQTRLTEQGKGSAATSADVVCKRELILLGDYACSLKAGAAP
jgi:hypothetical protein